MQEKRTPPQDNDHSLKLGPMLAKVIGHIEPNYLGTLEVSLLKKRGNDLTDDGQTAFVKYAPAFYGVTNYAFQGANKEDINDTQKSYGMWMVPPDVGVNVLCIFVDGNIADGYWIGCVPDKFANHMIPAIASSEALDISTEDKKKYDVSRLPVGEINRVVNDLKEGAAIDKIKKPVHGFADVLLTQGTLADDVRGITTSSARRDLPSAVFGISTPGPMDRRDNAKRERIGPKNSKTDTPVPVSRLGGTQFVMDDGDAQFQRKTTASDGPPEYADTLAKEKGEDNIPYSEYFRVRTRTGHQMLMHNSEDLIYIGNARGTTWIEMTSDGKIDIFAEDSVSIHTQNDFNFKAARDINIEAGRNVNIKATAEYEDPVNIYKEKGIFDASTEEKGRVYIESVENFNLLVGRNGKIHVRNNEGIQGNLDIKVMGNMRVSVKDKDSAPSVTNVGDKKIIAEQPEIVAGLHIRSFANTRITTNGKFELKTTGNNNFTTAADTSILSTGQHLEQANVIHMNGPPPEPAAPAEISDRVLKLTVYPNPVTNGNLEWTDRYKGKDVESIMKRVPMHEPWAFHEHLDPSSFKPTKTGRE